MFEIKVLPIISHIVQSYNRLDLFSIDSETSLQRKVGRAFKFSLFLSFPVFVLLGSVQNEDRSESLYMIAVSIAAFLHVIKFHCICTKMEIISVLLKELSVHSFQCKDKFIVIERKIKNFNYFSIGLIGVSSFVILLIYAFPFVFKKKLAFKIWFPLDWKKNDLNFWIAYAYIMYCLFICFLMIAFAVLMWYVLLNVSVKYRMLGYDLEDLGWNSLNKQKERSNNSLPSRNSESFYVDLVKCIENYKTLKGFDFR